MKRTELGREALNPSPESRYLWVTLPEITKSGYALAESTTPEGDLYHEGTDDRARFNMG
jgi:hypothetical protein